MATTQIKKQISPEIADGSPRFELDSTGKDVADHAGIKWLYVLCPHCGTRTQFSPLHFAVIVKEDEFGLVEKDYHYLCQCAYCSDVIYAKFWEVDFDPDWTFQYEMHYPTTLVQLGEHELPDVVRTSFSEATKCLNARADLATVVMCRRTIEAILADKGQKKVSNLATAINKLSTDKTIHESMAHLADLIRVVGNIGAHASAVEVESKQAKEVFDLTRRLIEMLYILPKRASDAKNKLEKAKSDSAPQS
jgi:hypothetical protein